MENKSNTRTNKTINSVNNSSSTITSTNRNKSNTNINTRIKTVENNVSKNISKLQNKALQNIPISKRIRSYTKGFTDLISGKSNINTNNNNTNNTNNTNNNKNNISTKSQFDNPIVLGIILLIAIGFISYGIYKYFLSINKIIYGKSFYGTDLLNYTPLFKINVPKIETCIDRCNKDTLCNGITFNDNTLQCVGTSKGVLRDDTVEHKAWIKPILELKTKTSTLLGYANNRKIITDVEIPKPGLPYEFNYSFYLYIEDFYKNQGNWKHILHKGSDIPINTIIRTKNWVDIERDYPSQSIGVWVAPFNNNIRIAITTERYINRNDKISQTHEYNHAYKQEIININNQQKIIISDKPSNPMRDDTRNIFNNNKEIIDDINYKSVLNIEYIDIYRIPIKKLNHISVNFQGLTMEIYINGNLYKIKELLGYPVFNDGNLFVMNNNTIDGYLIDLKFTPDRLIYNKILEQISNKLTLEEKIQKGIKGLNI